MRNTRKIIGILLMLSVLLSNNPLLYSAKAQDNATQQKITTPNPRDNAAFLEDEMEKFKANVLPLLEDKNAEEATEIFLEQLESFYDIVGLPFKWRYTDFYEFKMDWENHGITWAQNKYIIQGMPGDGELTEDEVIEIAEQTVLLLSGIPAEQLDICWPRASYHKPYPDAKYSWYIDFLVETPENEFAYYVKYMLEVDPLTGNIYYYFDSRSNQL